MGDWYIDRSRNIASIFKSDWYQTLVDYANNVTFKDAFRDKSQNFCSYLQLPTKNPYAILTYLRDLGIIDDNNNATDFFKCVLQSNLPIEQFILLILIKRNDNKSTASAIKPFVVLSKAFSLMRALELPLKLDWNQCVTYLMPISSYDEITEGLIRELCADEGDKPANGPDIWFNALLATGVFLGQTSEITLNPDHIELIEFIAHYGDELAPNNNREEYVEQAKDALYGLYILFKKHPFEAALATRNIAGVLDYIKEARIYDLSESKDICYMWNNSVLNQGINKIFYGVPGCGKSHHIQHNILDVGNYETNNVIRTTFYQDYSNTDFVGQILPKVVKGENGAQDAVEYIFNPGPFTLALIRAISNPDKKVALVIEEINRGNAPAIFGDIFQLLDRDDNSISEYGIVNVGMIDYLNSYEFEIDGEKVHYTFNDIKIPGNMDIFATMNTSDQNVYTLDTAFTRRWAKERIANSFDGNDIAEFLVPGMECTWGVFVDAINNQIQNKLDDLQVNEDKQVGAFFVKQSDLLAKDNTLSDSDKKVKAISFAHKVLEYLWDDVSKLDHSVIFKPNYKTFDKVVEDYIQNGVVVFNNEIFKVDTK